MTNPVEGAWPTMPQTERLSYIVTSLYKRHAHGQLSAEMLRRCLALIRDWETE